MNRGGEGRRGLGRDGCGLEGRGVWVGKNGQERKKVGHTRSPDTSAWRDERKMASHLTKDSEISNPD